MESIDMVTFESLSACDEPTLVEYFSDKSKDDLQALALKFEIPYKSNYSREELARHLANDIAMTGVFIRIAKKK